VRNDARLADLGVADNLHSKSDTVPDPDPRAGSSDTLGRRRTI
jgi:hypothetical protein